MSISKFIGRMIVDTSQFPFTPFHLNYIQGWLSGHIEANPTHRNHLLIVTIVDESSLLMELYDPGSVSHSSVETSVQHIDIELPPIVYESEPVKSDETKDVFKPPVGEA